LFGGGKKSDSKRAENRSVGIEEGMNGFDDDDDGDAGIGYQERHAKFAGRKGSFQYSESELITGKCATCDSLVRWPQRLDVYRCSVCLMVNDLKPATRDATRGNKSDTSPAMEIFRKCTEDGLIVGFATVC
jgi:E3 ubiquitin-protein ligase HECTD2